VIARYRTPVRQRGMTLIMALIMLVVLTLLALSSFNLGKSNLQIVSNMQHRDEAVAAAHEVMEETLSSTRFFNKPGDFLSAKCDGEANTTCFDSNQDGINDIKVAITQEPECVKVAPIKQETLDLEVTEDQLCAVGENQAHGVEGAVTGNSACSNTTWDVHAVATEIATKAQVEVVQGIAVRLPTDGTITPCGT